MVYEFIATITAGFLFAGFALMIKHLASMIKLTTPKWLLPAFAATGIFVFQIHQEYNWYQQTSNKLPDSVSVIKTIQTTNWYRPWTYIKPQTVRFMAIDTANISNNSINTDLKLFNLYLFERRMSAKSVPQLLDCKESKITDVLLDPTTKQPLASQNWSSLSANDPLLINVCSG